jgi:hypothetical protein
MKRIEFKVNEDQLTNLIIRMVNEAKYNLYEKEDEEDEEDEEEMTKQDAINSIADYFEDEFGSFKNLNMTDKKELKSIFNDFNSKSKSIKENRMKNIRNQAMIKGGLGVATTGAISALGEFMGFSGSKLTSKIHDLNHMVGLDEYTGPVTVAMVFAGLALYLAGKSKQYTDSKK